MLLKSMCVNFSKNLKNYILELFAPFDPKTSKHDFSRKNNFNLKIDLKESFPEKVIYVIFKTLYCCNFIPKKKKSIYHFFIKFEIPALFPAKTIVRDFHHHRSAQNLSSVFVE